MRKPIEAGDAAKKQYLELQVGRDSTLLLPTANVQEVLTVDASSVVPIPNMPSCMLGILNRHSRVYWVVNLAELLGLRSVDMGIHTYNVAIASADNIPIALVVYQVMGLIDIDRDRQSSKIGHMPKPLQPYLQGCTTHNNRELAVLNVKAILQSPALTDSAPG